MPSCGSRGLRFRERFKRAGIDFGCGWAYALRQLKKEPRGVLWPRKKLKSVRIRVAIVRRRRAASIAERTARVLPTGRRSRATAGMRSVAPARGWVRLNKRSDESSADLGLPAFFCCG